MLITDFSAINTGATLHLLRWINISDGFVMVYSTVRQVSKFLTWLLEAEEDDEDEESDD